MTAVDDRPDLADLTGPVPDAGGGRLTWQQYRARRRRRQVVHPVVVDEQAVAAYRRAKADPRTDPQRLADLEAAARDGMLLLRLEALPSEARKPGEVTYEDLRAQHPPTDADHADAAATLGGQARAMFNPRTFGPVLLAACLLEPAVSADEAAELLADLSEGERGQLLAAAIRVNTAPADTGGLIFS